MCHAEGNARSGDVASKFGMAGSSQVRSSIVPVSKSSVCVPTRPQEAAFVFSLLHPDPSYRPTVDSIVQSQLLLALHKSIRNQKTAGAHTPA